MDKTPRKILFIGLAENAYPRLSKINKCLVETGTTVDFVFEPTASDYRFLPEGFNVIVLDFELNGIETFDILTEWFKESPQLCVILLADAKSKGFRSDAMKAGAFDFIIKHNFDLELLERSVNYSFRHSNILAELVESQSKFKDLVEHLPAMFYISEIHPPYSQIYASPSFAKFGYKIEEWLRVKNMWSEILHPEDREWVLQQTDDAMYHGRATDYEYRILGKGGKIFWVHDRGHYYFSADGKAVYWQGMMNDITDRKEIEAKLLRKLQFDDLTNLRNRTGFVEAIDEALAIYAKDRSRKFAVFLLDMDRFKIVNDSLGHLFGDKFLIEVARRLEIIIGEKGLVARLSGDEFAILLQDAKNGEAIEEIASEICKSLSMPVKLDEYELSASVSAGITIPDENQKNVSEILRSADIAMYHAKASGKDCYKYYDEKLYSHNFRLVTLENELRFAIERNEFSLLYQPIVSLKTGKVSQVECLLRWDNQTCGKISPAEFIPIAEETGLIVPIGQWVLEEACRNLTQWIKAIDCQQELVIAINISAKQIVRPDFVDEISETLQKFSLEPQNLCLEITETSLMENGDYVLERMNNLHELGVKFSTDDFGTGYSSLSYLHKFPFNELKIDSSFISSLDERGKSRKIVKTIINLARSLELDIIAEGVETKEQLESLIELDCDFAQGYYFAKPIPASGMEYILDHGVQTLLHSGFIKQYAALQSKAFDLNETFVS